MVQWLKSWNMRYFSIKVFLNIRKYLHCSVKPVELNFTKNTWDDFKNTKIIAKIKDRNLLILKS